MLLGERIRRASYVPFIESDDPVVPPCTASTLKESTLAKITGIPLSDFEGGDISSFLQNHPVAGRAVGGAVVGHVLMGLCGGGVASLMAPLVSIVHLGQMGFDFVVIGGALMAAGAAAHAAAPLVMGTLGRKEENPQGFCAKLFLGAFDGLYTPVMAAGYFGSRIGRVAGATFGMAIGVSYGVARQGAILVYDKALRPLYENVLSPLLHCKPVESAKEKTHDLTTRLAHCPLPNYSVGANAAGLRLYKCFNKLMGNPPANSNMQQPASQPRPTGTDGPQNG